MPGYSKEKSAFKPPKKETVKKTPKPINRISEKKKAELENRKTWTVDQLKQAQKEGKKEKKQERKFEKEKSTPLSKIKGVFDQVYSLVVKMQPANSQGIVKCYCGVFLHWSKANNSHFIPRSTAPSIVHDRMNTHPSCVPCNGFKEGNRTDYIPWMNKKYGEEQVELLRLRGNKKSNIGTFEYQIMLQEYIELFLIECKRLNHTPTVAQQKIVDKWRVKNI
jgi:hypothetical protein